MENEMTTLFTIGFTRRSAEEFFGKLVEAGVRCVIDVRLNNTSQLAGFAKRDDLRYFLKAIGRIGYDHRPELAPSQEILDAYRKHKRGWPDFERDFMALLRERAAENVICRSELDCACLLCSEPTPAHCHRRLIGEYLQSRLGDIKVVHL